MKKESDEASILMEHALDVLLIFIPIAAVLHYSHAPELWTFIASGVAIIPLAGWMGKATESLAERLGAGIGGLLNATFGNAAEMIIAFQGLRAGLTEVVKGVAHRLDPGKHPPGIRAERSGRRAQVPGAEVQPNRSYDERDLDGVERDRACWCRRFFIGLPRGAEGSAERNISLEISIVLFVTYILSLVFALVTHKDLYLGTSEAHKEASAMRPRTAGIVLLGATALIAWMSELLVHAVEPASKAVGLTRSLSESSSLRSSGTQPSTALRYWWR